MPSGKLARTDDPTTWSNFLTVKGATKDFDGVGFVLTKDDHFVGLDFDHCRCPAFDGVDPEMSGGLEMVLPEITNHIMKLNTYTEVSPSGKGIRLFLRGSLPVDGKRKGPIEVYQSGRYMTVTGQSIVGLPRTIESRQEELDTFYQDVFGTQKEPLEQEGKHRSGIPLKNWRDRLEKAFKSKSGSAIQKLWEGDLTAYPSQSEADMALCSHLSFWLDGDPITMDQVFRESGLFRNKWDERHYSDGRTYGETTIERAIAGCNSFHGDRLPHGRESIDTAPPEGTPVHAEPVGTTSALDAVISRLASLSTLQYEQVRKTEAQKLGVRPRILDAAVMGARERNTTQALPFVEAELWPEQVGPAVLLTDIAAVIRRFIVCSEEASYAGALWVAMTWFIDVVQVAPLTVITSPEKRCGKSLMLSLLGKLSARAITASNISPAALFRTIEAWHPTLLIDEADAFMKDNEELRGILNSGHTRDSAYVIRNVGENFTPTKFNTWGAKALAGIGHVADTIMDRAIVLELRRKLPHEKVDRIRYADPKMFDELRSKLARFASDYKEQVQQARPPLPEELNDRQQDNWEPLLAIAMIAGDEWLQIAKTASLKLSGNENTSQTTGTELLADIQLIFRNNDDDRISTMDLINDLCRDDERPWKTYSKGFPITARLLAHKLKPFGISSKTIRIGDDTAKGYEKEQFTEAFSRYIPSPPSPSVTASQTAPVKGLRCFQKVTSEDLVTDENLRKPTPVKECDVVTDRMDNTRESIIADRRDGHPHPFHTDNLREVTI
jgi:putative DNA primase/helicase